MNRRDYSALPVRCYHVAPWLFCSGRYRTVPHLHNRFIHRNGLRNSVDCCCLLNTYDTAVVLILLFYGPLLNLLLPRSRYHTIYVDIAD